MVGRDLSRRGLDDPTLASGPSAKQYRQPVIEYQAPQNPVVIEYQCLSAQINDMLHRPTLMAATVALGLGAAPVQAACYADYKAKQDNPLRLHYGVIQLPDAACSQGAAAGVIRQRIARDGWQLLNVLGVFGDNGLNERRQSAGQYFLRY